jgi:hypothetical protein
MTSKQDDPSFGLFSPIRVDRISDKVSAPIKKPVSDGVVKVGYRLPSDWELAEEMGVSRASVYLHMIDNIFNLIDFSVTPRREGSRKLSWATSGRSSAPSAKATRTPPKTR